MYPLTFTVLASILDVTDFDPPSQVAILKLSLNALSFQQEYRPLNSALHWCYRPFHQP